MVSSLWDVIRVQDQVRAGCRQRLTVADDRQCRTDVDVARVQHEVPEDVTSVSGCGMTSGVAPMRDVSRVQHKVLAGCHGRLHIRGMSAHYALSIDDCAARNFDEREDSLSRRSEKLGLTLNESRRILLSNVRNTAERRRRAPRSRLRDGPRLGADHLARDQDAEADPGRGSTRNGQEPTWLRHSRRQRGPT